MNNVTVDFVCHSDDETSWSLVLVERGPWPESEVTSRLHALQDRLYGCIDAAIDGEVAKQFPESVGKRVEIRVEGYGLPEDVRRFFQAFSEEIMKTPDYAAAFAVQTHFTSVNFSLSLNKLSASTMPQ